MVDKKPLLKRSFGGSKYPWNNLHMGTSSACCQICGTSTKVDEDSRSLTIDAFLGYQMVEECCGGLLDLIYEESGEEFAIRFLKEFGKDPFNPRFSIFFMVMTDVFASLDKKTVELHKQIKKNQKTLSSFKDIKH